MKVIFLPPADKELEDAITYYNEQLHGLGDQFYEEFLVGIDFIQKYPIAWQKVGENTRRFILKRFPYMVLYVVEDESIIITVIAHQHRHPDYYLKR